MGTEHRLREDAGPRQSLRWPRLHYKETCVCRQAGSCGTYQSAPRTETMVNREQTCPTVQVQPQGSRVQLCLHKCSSQAQGLCQLDLTCVREVHQSWPCPSRAGQLVQGQLGWIWAVLLSAAQTDALSPALTVSKHRFSQDKIVP